MFYGIGLRMSLRRRTILSKRLRAPTRVDLTIHIFRTVDRTTGRRFVQEEVISQTLHARTPRRLH